MLVHQNKTFLITDVELKRFKTTFPDFYSDMLDAIKNGHFKVVPEAADV